MMPLPFAQTVAAETLRSHWSSSLNDGVAAPRGGTS